MSGRGAGDTADDATRQAVHRLRARRSFRRHLIVYVAVNALLVVSWLVSAVSTGRWYPWSLYALAGWGIGLAAHAWAVYGSSSLPFPDEAIAREAARIRRQQLDG